MKIHHIKTITPYFYDAKQGKKPFELRKDDRNYVVGDILHHYLFDDGEIKEDNFYQLITYKLSGFVGIDSDYCILGVENITE